jgi:hypothetical protein
MIHYHGGPVTPIDVARTLWTRRHAMVSFYHPDQITLAAEVCQSFALDNGAFSAWKSGTGPIDTAAYVEWVQHWHKHPGFDFALIPDVIDGDEHANNRMIAEWFQLGGREGVPVWHLHESIDRLKYLCHAYQRVALGSSGIYSEPGYGEWWPRMHEAMVGICDEEGRPPCKLHGLRMLNPTIFSHLPLSSADSVNVGRNIGLDGKWDRAPYAPRSKAMRALIICDRIEHHASASTYQRTAGIHENLELIG